jgi:hypothetical protein
MKRLLYILFFLFTITTAFAQDERPGAARLKEKMVEYIQDKMGLNKTEAERFQPLFFDYLNRLREVKKEYENDRLQLQKKIIDVRIKFRDQIKPLVGEKRSNDVFTYERDFVNEVRDARKERLQERPGGRANKRKNSKL